MAIRAQLESEGHKVRGFSRTNGFDLKQEGTIPRLLECLSDSDVFINNAYSEWAQTELLYALFAKWKTEERVILNISSNSADTTKSFEHKYAIAKGALDSACIQLNQIGGARCRVVNVRPGWVRTPRIASLHVQEPVLDPIDVARTVSWILNLPKGVHVPQITLVARES